MECSCALQVLPLDAQTSEDVCRIVDEVIAYIDSTKLSYFVGPFETTIEGDLETCFEVLKQAQYIAQKSGATDIMSYIKVHYAPAGEVLTTSDKISKYLQVNEQNSKQV